MEKRIVPVDGVLPYDRWGFTNCVRHGDVLYLSGISGVDEEGRVVAPDIQAQTVRTFQNIERVLRAAGSGLDRILQMTGFVVDLERNGSLYVATRQRILTGADYTSATIGVSALMIPGLLLEVQCLAAV